MPKKYDLIDKRFGKLVVKKKGNVTNQGQMWECVCDCGNVAIYRTSMLISGDAVSCGCLRHDPSMKRNEARKAQKVNGVELFRFENDKAMPFNSTGAKGVSKYLLKNGGTKYEAKIVINGTTYRKKGFDTIEDAKNYRKQLEELYLPKKSQK